MYPAITYSLLVEKKACKSQLDLFEKHFGKVKSIPLTKEVATKFGSLFDIGWVAYTLLTKEDLTEYRKVIDPAEAEYTKVIVSAYAEYLKVYATDALVEYNKVYDAALGEFRKARALAFVEIYERGMKKST